jgi:hypothetical protein
MPYTKYAITSLSQGVSQQAESQRHPSQAVEQINGYSSHIKGLVKRPPTKHLNSIDVHPDDATSSFLHIINRDEQEQYAVVINKNLRLEVDLGNPQSAAWYFSYQNPDESDSALVSNGELISFFIEGLLDTFNGIKTGTDYYIVNTSVDTGTSPDTHKFQVATTSGGTALTVGQVQLTDAEFGATDDQYKAGLLIESVKVTDNANSEIDGSWIDGVITVRFQSVTSGIGHTYVEGDEIHINDLSGLSRYLVKSGGPAFLTKKAPDDTTIKTIGGDALSTGETANKFWLTGPSDNYYQDGPSNGASGLVGWTQLGDGSIAYDSGTDLGALEWSLDDWSLDIEYGTLSAARAATLKPGQLVKLGSHHKNQRAIIKSVTAGAAGTGKIVLIPSTTQTQASAGIEKYDANANGTGDYFDAWSDEDNIINLWFWSRKSDYSTRCPDELDYRESASGDNTTDGEYAWIGTDDVTYTAFQSKKGSGPFVYDLQTGAKIPLAGDIDQRALQYLMDIDDPSSDLRAVTVGDTTFLLNKTISVRDSSYEPYPEYKSNQAFLTIMQADYGKYYRVYVGKETVTLDAADPNDVVAKKSETFFYGNTAGNDLPRKVVKIRAKKLGFEWNRFEFRLAQNWYGHGQDGNSSKTKGWWDYKGSYDVPPGKEARKAKSKDPQTAWYWHGFHRDVLNLENTKQAGRDNMEPFQDVKRHVHKNFRAAIDCYRDPEEFVMWVNFPWAKHGGDYKNKHKATTTVTELVTYANSLAEFNENWEMLPCDEAGLVEGEAGFDSDTVVGHDDEDWHFLKIEVHADFISMSQSEWSWGDMTFGRDTEYYGGTAASPWAYSHLVGGWFWTFIFVPGLVTRTLATSGMTFQYLNRSLAYTTDGRGTVPVTEFSPKRTVYDGEFYYKSPRWTGEKDDQAPIGTQRIAEALSSDAIIINGGNKKVDNDGALVNRGIVVPKKPDGRPIVDGLYHADMEEEAIGLDAFGGGVRRASGDHEFLSGAERPWDIRQRGNVVAIRHPENIKFDITVDDDMGGNGLTLTYTEVSEASKLPEICQHGHVVRVVGDAREEADDYYLKFHGNNPKNHDLQNGTWKECLGYGQKAAFDPRTLPVVLTREYDADGNRFFSLKLSPWRYRQAGDNQTNPFPSFTHKPLTDIFLYKNRLGFLSGESVILSESGEHFNLFRSTVAALLDTAPIDVGTSTTAVSKLNHAIPFSNQLLLFSSQAQFALTGEPFFSPKTVQLATTSKFENSVVTKPINAGSMIFFTYPRSEFGAVSEYFVSKDQIEAMESRDISAHIPKYISGKVISMASCPEEKVLVVLTDDSTQAVVYIYKYFLDAQGQKTQSAWSKYVVGDSDDKILALRFIANTLYLVIKRNDLVVIESLVFEDDQKDTGLDYQVLLDRRQFIDGTTASNVTYDSNTGISSVTLDYTPTAKEKVEVVTIAGGRHPTATLTTDVATFAGVNLKATTFFIGQPYDFKYTLSRPHLRKNTGTGGRGVLLGGRFQLTRGTLEFSGAKKFDVKVTHYPQDVTTTNSYSFTGVELGYASAVIGADTLSEGAYTFGIMGRNDRISIDIENTSPYPADFLSFDYEGNVYSRGARWTG